MADPVHLRRPWSRQPQSAWIVGLLVSACILWLFGRGFLTGELFAYRDGAHYHFPLFTYVSERWSEGEIPLWNPADNLGQPLAGDPTAAVFYPPRLVAALLPLGPIRQYQAYVVLHLAAAMAGVFLLARAWRCGIAASGAGAIAYGLSGAVLFQYCNEIFLVGAAWWPAALAAIESVRNEGSWKSAMMLAAVLAMMVLGGDAEAAYLALAAAAWRYWWLAGDAHAQEEPADDAASPPASAGMPMSRILVTIGLLAASLAAAQIVPACMAIVESGRATSDRPRSLYDVPAYITSSEPASWEGVAQGLLGPPQPDTHEEHIYWFSVAPWRVAEALVPNCWGREFPENRRWSAAVADEGALWTPSLYFGILPLVVGIGGLRFFAGSIRSRWLSWLFLVGLIASFGWYGLGWLTGLAPAAPGQEPSIGPQTGGLYWLFTIALPAFAQFRYPAKLLVPAMVAFSLIVAREWRIAICRREWLAARLVILAAIAGMGLMAVIIGSVAWEAGIGANNGRLAAWFADPLDNPLFGPLDRLGGWWDLVAGLCQTMAIAGVSAAVLRFSSISWRDYLPLGALAITAVDLLVANSWLVQFAAVPPVELKGPIAAEIARLPAEHRLPPRIYRAGDAHWWPADWKKTSSPNRLADNLVWEWHTLRAKYHLLQGWGALESHGPWSRRDYETTLQIARESNRRGDLPNAVAEMLGSDWVIGPSQADARQPRRLEMALEGGSEKVGLVKLHPRRAWIASTVVHLPALTDTSTTARRSRTEEVLLDRGRLRDFRRVCVVEGAEAFDEFPADRPAGERCEVVKAYPEYVELAVKLHSPGLVVLADGYDSGWSVLVSETSSGQTQEGAILRVNRVLRGVLLPPGEHQVQFIYQPPGIVVAIWLSAAAWLFWLIWMGVVLWREREERLRAVKEANPEDSRGDQAESA